MKTCIWNKTEIVDSLDDLRRFVERELNPRWGERDLLLLKGPLGVGKTQLTRFIASFVGEDESVASPTFAIHHRYEWPHSTMDHLDFYRIENQEDLESTGFWDLFSQSKGMIVVEWANNLDPSMFPENWTIWLIEMDFEGPMNVDAPRRRLQISLYK